MRDELIEKIVQFEWDYDSYEVSDQFGNIECDIEAKENLTEYISNTLESSSNILIENLEEYMNEMDEDDELYKTAKELIEEIKTYQLSLNNEMEI